MATTRSASARPVLSPAFGQADLSNCEREQIHLAGSIQPSGALLAVREPDLTIVQASANARTFLGLEHPVRGRSLHALAGDLAARVRPHLSDSLHTLPVGVRCHVGRDRAAFDGLLHRPPGGGLVIELERAGPPVDLRHHVQSALHTILAATSLRALAEETTRLFRDITGYDRVMVYRFDDEGHGEVFTEQRRTDLEAFLGNRYPASDIPQIARRLYERNRVRVLADVAAVASPLDPVLSPITGQPLDMSLCFLRSMSPIHLQYLTNMGVAATLVASLLVGGRLWGLVACHHCTPRFAHFETRAVCELLAEAVGTRIAALESFAQGQAELSVRRLEQRMVQTIGRDGDWKAALFDSPQALLHPLGATGAALLFENEVLSRGDVPGTQDLREIGRWLDTQPRAPVIASASLGLDAPQFASLIPVASGVLATPVSTSPGEWLVWFRPERVRTVTWGGNPFKPAAIGDTPASLSPRRSFAQWHQLVEGTSDPWTRADQTAARLIGAAVADVVLQFRSVRMLIAQDQLDQVSRQVGAADAPVVIADADGRVLLVNDALRGLLPATGPAPATLDDLASLFAEPIAFRRRLGELLRHGRTWRGEVRLDAPGATARAMMLRADPVFAAPWRVLGYVLLFTDLTERHAAEAARRRFQDGILARRRAMTGRLDSDADLRFRDLLAAVVENAQLAALEITDGPDAGRMPEMLDSVRNSVARTAEVLERLLWHASRAAGRRAT